MNIRPYIILNGISSLTIKGLLVTDLPPITKPLVRTQVDVIDGRDGDIVTKLGYSAYDKPVKVGLTENFLIDDIIDFFNSEGVVTFSNEPEKYYRYAIYDQIDFERLLRFKTAEINLHVQPFKYALAESVRVFNFEYPEEVEELEGSFNIRNNGNYFSRPIISITGSGTVNLYLNGAQVLVIELGETSQTITIDAEAMNAYYSDNTLANRAITGNYDNIMLKQGKNEISYSGNVTQITIYKFSRWV